MRFRATFTYTRMKFKKTMIAKAMQGSIEFTHPNGENLKPIEIAEDPQFFKLLLQKLTTPTELVENLKITKVELVYKSCQ